MKSEPPPIYAKPERGIPTFRRCGTGALPYCLRCVALSAFEFIASLAIALAPFSPVYALASKQARDHLGFGEAQTRLAASELLKYLWTGASYDLRLSPQATMHLGDVRHLFLVGQAILFVTAFISFKLLRAADCRQVVQTVVGASTLVVLEMAALALALWLDFQPAFASFHRLLFSNPYWMFDADDSLVRFFPPSFFNALMLDVAGAIIVGCGLLLTCAVIYVRGR